MPMPTTAEMDMLKFSAEHGVEFDDEKRGIIVRILDALKNEGNPGNYDVVEQLAAARVEDLTVLSGVGAKKAAAIIKAAKEVIGER